MNKSNKKSKPSLNMTVKVSGMVHTGVEVVMECFGH